MRKHGRTGECVWTGARQRNLGLVGQQRRQRTVYITLYKPQSRSKSHLPLSFGRSRTLTEANRVTGLKRTNQTLGPHQYRSQGIL